MLNEFVFKLPVKSEWIDYNKHMQDAYYGLAFSYAVDHFQDCVGFDERYRTQSGCTIYVLEDHKFYLNEVKLGTELLIKTSLVATDKKKFILHSQMSVQNTVVATAEMLQAHINTKPKPRVTEMPTDIYESFRKLLGQSNKVLYRRSRKLSLND
jgi:acyl-CoA thioester hydrolase